MTYKIIEREVRGKQYTQLIIRGNGDDIEGGVCKSCPTDIYERDDISADWHEEMDEFGYKPCIIWQCEEEADFQSRNCS